MDTIVNVNMELCSGCQACCVACMDQNGLAMDKDRGGWRKVIAIESGEFPSTRIAYLSFSCLNCRESNCLAACPSGALFRTGNNGTVQVDHSRCIGCRSCAAACSHGMPRFGKEGKMEKCDGCGTRVAAGLLPACVRTCPTGALKGTGE